MIGLTCQNQFDDSLYLIIFILQTIEFCFPTGGIINHVFWYGSVSLIHLTDEYSDFLVQKNMNCCWVCTCKNNSAYSSS